MIGMVTLVLVLDTAGTTPCSHAMMPILDMSGQISLRTRTVENRSTIRIWTPDSMTQQVMLLQLILIVAEKLTFGTTNHIGLIISKTFLETFRHSK